MAFNIYARVKRGASTMGGVLWTEGPGEIGVTAGISNALYPSSGGKREMVYFNIYTLWLYFRPIRSEAVNRFI